MQSRTILHPYHAGEKFRLSAKTFRADKDSKPGKLVFNRTVVLKDHGAADDL
ncbi:MAG: hypothetical protein IPG90_18040 [Bacteroidetes bacterium]|nr:hypothetical protein [Bacteroidota bacterium]